MRESNFTSAQRWQSRAIGTPSKVPPCPSEARFVFPWIFTLPLSFGCFCEANVSVKGTLFLWSWKKLMVLSLEKISRSQWFCSQNNPQELLCNGLLSVLNRILFTGKEALVNPAAPLPWKLMLNETPCCTHQNSWDCLLQGIRHFGR